MSAPVAGRPYAPYGFDPWELAERAISAELRGNGGFMRRGSDLRSRAVSYLVPIVWYELAPRFDPGRGKTFDQYAISILRLRVNSFYREELPGGDTRYGRERCPACHGGDRAGHCITCEGRGTIARPGPLSLEDENVGEVADRRDRVGEVVSRVFRAV